MLKLGRNEGETIIIGDDIEVTVLQIKGKSVVIGIDAPDDVRVLREEVSCRIQQEDESDRNLIWKIILGEEPIELR